MESVRTTANKLGLLSCLFSPANGEILIRVICYVEEPDIISSPPVSQRLMAAEVASKAQRTLLVFFLCTTEHPLAQLG